VIFEEDSEHGHSLISVPVEARGLP
jgi:hypothetical protein